MSEDAQEEELLKRAQFNEAYTYANRLYENIMKREIARIKKEYDQNVARINKSTFIFRKLPSLGSQQLVFEYFDLSELIELRGLNFSFSKLLRSGAVPSVIKINSRFRPKLLINLMKRPKAKSVVTTLDFRDLQFALVPYPISHFLG